MLVHLATSTLKPLCGKRIETEPLDILEPGMEVCAICQEQQRVRRSGYEYILLGELVSEGV